MTSEIKKIRKIWLATVCFEAIFFAAAGFAWLFWFSSTLHVWWLLLPVLPIH